MAIKLTISGTQADLLKTQTLELNQFSDFFNLEIVKATVSLPFNLPKTPTNRKLFKHVDIPASNQPITKEFPAVVEIDGLVAKEGVFVLTGIKKEFEGFIKADAGLFSPIKDNLIGSFVDELLGVPLINAGFFVDFQATYTQFFDGRFDNISSPVVFPEFIADMECEALRNDTASRTGNNPDFFTRIDSEFGIPVEVLDSPFAPFVKIKYILQKVIESQGFRAIFETSDLYVFEQACLIPTKATLENQMNLSEFIPEMKVAEFIASIKKMGLAFKFNSHNSTCTITPFKDIIAEKSHKELTPFIIPDSLDLKNLELNPEIVNLEFAESQETDGITIAKRLASNETTFVSNGDILVNEYVLVDNVNAYYQKQSYTQQPNNAVGIDDYFSRHIPATFIQQSEGFDKDVKSGFIPCPNSTKIQRGVGEGPNLNGEGNPKPIGKFITEVFGISLDQVNYYRILDSEEYGDCWHVLETYGTYNNFYRIATLNFVAEVTSFEAEVEYVLDGGRNRPYISADLAGKPLITLWHGLQTSNETGSTEKYRFASSGNWSPNGNIKLAETAFRWEDSFREADGIESQLFQEFTQVSQNRKSFTYEGKLKLSDCLNFDPFQKILIDWVEYLVVSFKPTYHNARPNERVDVELELRRV
jgi:hypothetical protein